jgi:hypothetical protein
MVVADLEGEKNIANLVNSLRSRDEVDGVCPDIVSDIGSWC